MKPLGTTRRLFLRMMAGSGMTFLLVSARAERLMAFLQGERSVSNVRIDNDWKTDTFDPSACLHALVIGDWGAGSALQKRVADGMSAYAAKEHPHMIISTGDNFYPAGVRNAADPQFVRKWKNIYSSPHLSVPWYVALGNHDYGADVMAQVEYGKTEKRWNMPSTYYRFTRNDNGVDADFFVLDTQRLLKADTDEREAQLRWLEQELKASRATWKVVVGHHMIRSYGAYGDQSFMLTYVKPLLDRYKVDLYLNGHDHDIQYIKHPDDTFTCVISGAGGGARDTAYGASTLYAATNGGFVALIATAKRLHVRCMNAAGTIMYARDVR